MNTPRVSVVMPVHNGQQYLALAIESILQQTFRDFEFFIVNDGSTDHSEEIIQSYAARDPRIVALKSVKRGLAEALNTGCRAARADYVARMDCDDIARPDRFARQVEWLDQHPDVAVLGGAAQLIDAEGRPLSELRYKPEGDSLKNALSSRSCVIHPSVMMRKAILRKVGLYRESCAPAEDYDLWSRVADSHVVMNLPGAVLLDFRMHDGQVSQTKRRRQLVIAMAVQRAAIIRRHTGTDPLAKYADVDDMAARDLGITDCDIERAHIDIEYHRAIDLVGRGLSEGKKHAREMVSSLEKRTFSNGGRKHLNQRLAELEAGIQVETIRELVRARRYCAAALQCFVAGLRRPQVWGRAIASLSRNWQSL